MKSMEKKKKISIGAGLVVLALLLGVVAYFLPKAKTGNEIAALLKPVIESENQSMRVNLQFMISGKETSIDTTMYFLTEGEEKYLVVEQDGHCVYMVEDVLLLENGQAFLIRESEEVEIKGIDLELFSQIAALYEALEIDTSREDDTVIYSIEVSGDDAQELIGHVMPEIYSELSEIENLKIDITAKEDELTSVSYSGGATVNGKNMSLKLRVADFKTLESGEYVIPEEIKTAVKHVDKDELFCITKDLYRLMVAFADLASQEKIEGTVKLSANSGIISFKKSYDLSELDTHKADLENATEIEQLPDMISLLCMEGDIACEEATDGYHYTLKLNKNTMEEITEMILPSSVSQLIKLSKGNVEIVVNGSKIKTIEIGIAGSIQSIFSSMQSQVGIEFIFD